MSGPYIKLEPEDIRRIHDKAIAEYGGLAGEYEPGQIDFMADKPFQEAFGQELYPGLFMKAAVYWHGFAVSQYFCDGNKRTGTLCCLVFLKMNGYQLNVDEDRLELYHMAKKIANKEVDLEALADWIQSNSEPI